MEQVNAGNSDAVRLQQVQVNHDYIPSSLLDIVDLSDDDFFAQEGELGEAGPESTASRHTGDRAGSRESSQLGGRLSEPAGQPASRPLADGREGAQSGRSFFSRIKAWFCC